LHAVSIANIALDSEGAASSLLDLFGRRVDGPRELGVFGDSLGCNSDVGSISGAALGDFESDSTRGSCDEDGLPAQRLGLSSLEVERNECFQRPHWHGGRSRSELLVHLV